MRRKSPSPRDGGAVETKVNLKVRVRASGPSKGIRSRLLSLPSVLMIDTRWTGRTRDCGTEDRVTAVRWTGRTGDCGTVDREDRGLRYGGPGGPGTAVRWTGDCCTVDRGLLSLAPLAVRLCASLPGSLFAGILASDWLVSFGHHDSRRSKPFIFLSSVRF